jgi:drug/metabolite transporter (DMT)-like permease
VAALAGTSNFLNGFLEHQDFTVTCLNFSGFFLLGLAYKVYSMMKAQKPEDVAFKRVLFHEFYDFSQGRVNWEYTLMLVLRVGLLLVALWAAIMSIYYANLANINFGIISCCFIFSIVVNITAGYAIFQEKISPKQVAGIVVTVAGIIWISLAKGEVGVKKDTGVRDDEANWYKNLSVMLAISVGAMNASTTVQAKWMRKKRPSIDVMNLTADTFLLFALIFSLITLVMIFMGDSSLTMRNFLIVLASSSLQTLCGYIGLNCSVKGIAGPTITLIYT